MTTIPISEKYNPVTAFFWGRYPTEMGKAEGHCPTVALFENQDGEFFAVAETRRAPRHSLPVTGEITGNAELVAEVREWLDGRIAFLISHLP